VYPTHGAGSFCSAPPGAERTTTIGQEKATNPLVAADDQDAFVKTLLASLGTFPGYFLRLPEENRRGPAVVPATPVLTPLTPGQVLAVQNGGSQVIDVRPVPAYAAGHIPDSLAIPLREAFATWLGWLVPDPASPLVVVADPGQDLSEVIWQALKIGYSPGRWPTARPPGKQPGSRWRPPRCSPPVRWTRPGSSTCGKPASTAPGTCPAPATSNSAPSPARPPACRPGRW
jgi:rhodanese-related sulfurtransferase